LTTWFDEDGKLRLGWRIVLAVLLSITVNILALWIGTAAGRSDRSVDAVYRPTAMLLLLAVYTALLLFADRIHTNPLSAMGLGRQHAIRQSLTGIALGFAMISIGVLGIAMVGRLSFTIRMNPHIALLLLVELFILATGAMTEELMFRGYPFQRLVEAVGPVVTVLMMSALFGLAHVGNPHASFWAVTNTIVVGVLLSIAYLRTRSLWLPWGIHFGWNFALGVAYGLPVSGLNEFAVTVHGHATGPTWLTGGAYGLEGGALGTMAIAAGFIPLFWLTGRFHQEQPAAAL
jgi:membrane protease YdiL (CAAX protease family)